MGRHAEGFTIRRKGSIWCVRFRVDGKQREYSTGIQAPPKAKRPSAEAVRQGEQIYAAALTGKRPTTRKVAAHARGAPLALAELCAEWLDDLPVRGRTRDLYEKYTVYWLGEWRSTTQLTDAAMAAYQRKRLRESTRKTTNNELSALRRFVAWLAETGVIHEAPAVPLVPPGINGKPYVHRRRVKAPELSTDEVEGILSRLPEWSGGEVRKNNLFPVRARFVVMWETTIRPETLDVLEVPTHWAPGETTIRIRPEDDKEAYAREVPLTARAIAALKSVAPKEGPIFGQHRYGDYLAEAAKEVLPAAKAAIFAGQHIRSAAITRWLEASSNLPGVQHLAGHKHAATTGRYVRPTFRAALEVIGSAEKPTIRGKKRGKRKVPGKKKPKNSGT